MKKFLIALITTVVLAGSAQAQTTTQAQATAKVNSVNPKIVKDMLAAQKDIILLDVRTFEEFVAGRIEGSVLLPYDEIDAASAARVIGPNKGRTVIVYCRSGRRSGIAASTLVSLGYEKVLDLGGIVSWPYATVKGEPGIISP